MLFLAGYSAPELCGRIDSAHGAQYLTYEHHGKGDRVYANESEERVWLRLHNNTSCSIQSFGGAPEVVRTLPDGTPTVALPDGQEVFMELEVTDPKAGGLHFSPGDVVSLFWVPPKQSVVFAVPVNYLQAGPIGVRFRYPWDGGLEAVEHRVIFDPKDLPAGVRTWLASVDVSRVGK